MQKILEKPTVKVLRLHHWLIFLLSSTCPWFDVVRILFVPWANFCSLSVVFTAFLNINSQPGYSSLCSASSEVLPIHWATITKVLVDSWVSEPLTHHTALPSETSPFSHCFHLKFFCVHFQKLLCPSSILLTFKCFCGCVFRLSELSWFHIQLV